MSKKTIVLAVFVNFLFINLVFSTDFTGKRVNIRKQNWNVSKDSFKDGKMKWSLISGVQAEKSPPLLKSSSNQKSLGSSKDQSINHSFLGFSIREKSSLDAAVKGKTNSQTTRTSYPVAYNESTQMLGIVTGIRVKACGKLKKEDFVLIANESNLSLKNYFASIHVAYFDLPLEDNFREILQSLRERKVICEANLIITDRSLQIR